MARPAVVWVVFWLAGIVMTLGGESWTTLHGVLALFLFALIGIMAVRGKRKQAYIALLALVIAATYGGWRASGNGTDMPTQAEALRMHGYLSAPIKADGDRIRFTLDMVEPERGQLAVTVIAASPDELEHAERWRRGDKLTLEGELALPGEARNFGQFDYRKFLNRQRIHRVFTVRGLEAVEHDSAAGWDKYAVLRAVDRMRGDMLDRIGALFADKHAGLMAGLLIGHQEDIEEERYQVFSRLGLTHVIAISGLHVGIVVGVLLALLRLLRLTRETSLTVAIAFVPAYVLLTGAAPSIVRAGMMSMIALYALKRGWLKDGLNILAVAAGVMTVWNPYYIYSVGFQLSFAVTAGLIMIAPKLTALLPGPRWLAGAIAVTVAAQLVSLPLTVYYFNQFALVSFVANFLLVPVFSLLVLPAGYAALLLSYAGKPPAMLLADCVSFIIDCCYKLMDALDRLPGMMIWATPSAIWIFVYYLLLWFAIVLAHRLRAVAHPMFLLRKRRMLAALVCLLGAFSVCVVGGWQYGLWQSRGTVSFLDVGQGDAILVRTPGNRTLLIDGGGTARFYRPGEEWRARSKPYEVGADLLLPLLRQRGVRNLDYVVATHGHADHIGGLPAVLQHIPTQRLLFNGTRSSSDAALFEAAAARAIPVYAATAGRRIVIDKHTSLELLHPLTDGGLQLQSDQNRHSVAFILRMRHYVFVFTGDMDASAERAVLAYLADGEDGKPLTQLPPRQSDVVIMKVAHHGSRTSTTAEWLRYWSPDYAVISAGANNRYGHPNANVLERLAQYGSDILRTDRHGEVQFRLRGGEFGWRTKLQGGEPQ